MKQINKMKLLALYFQYFILFSSIEFVYFYITHRFLQLLPP